VSWLNPLKLLRRIVVGGLIVGLPLNAHANPLEWIKSIARACVVQKQGPAPFDPIEAQENYDFVEFLGYLNHVAYRETETGQMLNAQVSKWEKQMGDRQTNKLLRNLWKNLQETGLGHIRDSIQMAKLFRNSAFLIHHVARDLDTLKLPLEEYERRLRFVLEMKSSENMNASAKQFEAAQRQILDRFPDLAEMADALRASGDLMSQDEYAYFRQVDLKERELENERNEAKKKRQEDRLETERQKLQRKREQREREIAKIRSQYGQEAITRLGTMLKSYLEFVAGDNAVDYERSLLNPENLAFGFFDTDEVQLQLDYLRSLETKYPDNEDKRRKIFQAYLYQAFEPGTFKRPDGALLLGPTQNGGLVQAGHALLIPKVVQ